MPEGGAPSRPGRLPRTVLAGQRVATIRSWLRTTPYPFRHTEGVTGTSGSEVLPRGDLLVHGLPFVAGREAAVAGGGGAAAARTRGPLAVGSVT